MDAADRAGELEQQMRDEALERQRARAAQPLPLSATQGVCVDCGEPIALARLQALPYARHCIECAQVVMARARLRGVRG